MHLVGIPGAREDASADQICCLAGIRQDLGVDSSGRERLRIAFCIPSLSVAMKVYASECRVMAVRRSLWQLGLRNGKRRHQRQHQP